MATFLTEGPLLGPLVFLPVGGSLIEPSQASTEDLSTIEPCKRNSQSQSLFFQAVSWAL